MKKALAVASLAAFFSQHAAADPWPHCSMLPNCNGGEITKHEKCFLKINCNEIVRLIT